MGVFSHAAHTPSTTWRAGGPVRLTRKRHLCGARKVTREDSLTDLRPSQGGETAATFRFDDRRPLLHSGRG
jgi:hypothetical protein